MMGLERVGVRYGGTWAVRDVDLVVQTGSCTALVGPSGAGKSSLLLALNRLHDLDASAHVEGRVTLDGTDVASLDDRVLRRRVGLLFQRPTPFPLSIRENLAFPLRAHGTARSELDGRVESALTAAALWSEVSHRLDHAASTLSGGQLQRLCLARALALEPDVLLLDEPCAALDPASTMRVEDALAGLGGRVTRLIVTHNLGQARRLADTCVCLWPGAEGGRVVEHGPVGEVLSAPSHPELAAWLSGALG
ncbi:MAG: ATP-binding cassette domain-containing protein [Myxococcota bacterium]